MENNHILNKVFTRKTLDDLLKKGESHTLNAIYQTYFNDGPDRKNIEKIRKLYLLLEKKYRNEYYFKNTMLNKLLLGRHSIKTTTALSEVWLNRSKADFVLINGKAIVYEIKTELDNLDRLNTQISDYYKVFDHVEVITDEKHCEKLLKRYKDSSVGISIITKRKTIKNVKAAQPCSTYLDYLAIYKLLRKEERYNLLQHYFGQLPATNAFTEYEEHYKLFQSIPIEELYSAVLKELKLRDKKVSTNIESFLAAPYEIKSLLYFGPLGKQEYERLNILMEEG